jgi:exopolysaccharide biosynthesis polyprenyl glycosylphosphotransferase
MNLARRLYAPLSIAAQVVLDLATVGLACALAYALWSRTQRPEVVQPFSFYLGPFAIMGVFQVSLFAAFGMYRLQKSLLNLEEFRGVIRAAGWGILLLYTLLVLLRETTVRHDDGGVYGTLARFHGLFSFLHPVENYSRAVLLGSHVLFVPLAAIVRFLAFRTHQELHARGIGHVNVLIYGSGDLGQRLQKRLRLSPRLGYHLAGFLDEDRAALGVVRGGSAVVRGGSGKFEEVARAEDARILFVAEPRIHPETLAGLFAVARRLGIEVHVIPPFYDVVPRSVAIAYFDSIPVLTVRRETTRPLARAAKRALDLVVGGVLLALVSPLFLLLPPLVRRQTGGPALFRQERVGLGGRIFRMYKFRTMRVDAPAYAVKPRDLDDPRVPPLGRWLRRWSLDEVPQLLNVLRGEMSLVGPRPEMPFIVAGYGDYARERLVAKPGITGLWQISAAREEAIHQNVDYDLYYIEHQSLLLDLIVLGLTAVSVLRGAGAR